MKNFDKLIQEVETAKLENDKFQTGNQSAGRRLRNSLLVIKNLAHESRKEVLEQCKANKKK